MDYTTTFTVDASPADVFAAINNVRGWWTGDIEGESAKVGDEFSYRYEDLHYSKQKVTELVPGKKVVWHVVDSSINFVADKHEWTGTDIVFDIAEKDGKTQVTFTHRGLVPAIACYGDCSGAWGYYVNTSLKEFILNGDK